MAQILIRDLDAALVEHLKRRARARGRSLQAEVKGILQQALRVDPGQARRLADRIRRKVNRRFSDSTGLVRAVRKAAGG